MKLCLPVFVFPLSSNMSRIQLPAPVLILHTVGFTCRCQLITKIYDPNKPQVQLQ